MEQPTESNTNRPASDSPASAKNTFHSKRFNLFILAAVLFIAAASFLMMRSEAVTGPANVIYVTVNGGSDGTADNPRGSSWEYAYASNDLQTAINAAATSNDADASANAQVWVQAGEYTRSQTLNLTAKAKVYGGFKGDETSIASRDVRIKGMMAYPMSADYATILNGNGGNFSIVEGGTGATSADTFLNGFTITGGKGTSGKGGGMYNISSSPAITNCTFYKNGYNQTIGAGIYNQGSSPVIKNSIFRENSIGNSTSGHGGAILNTTTSNAIITGCSFINNTAITTGGAIINMSSSPVITNCTFAGNKSTGESGGAICNEGSSSIAVITNCTFTDNHADNTSFGGGGAVLNQAGGKAVIYNSIFWGNSSHISGAEDIYNNPNRSPASSADVRYSLLKNGYADGTGIISGDPKLISVDVNMGAPATSADLYMYIISGDSAARGEGFGVGETISGNVKVPATDQVGNPRAISQNNVINTHYVDLGAYQFSSVTEGHTPSYSFPVLSITSAKIKVGESVDVTATATPSNFVEFAPASNIADVVTSGDRMTFTGTKRGTQDIEIWAAYLVSSNDTQHYPKASTTFSLTVTENVTVASGDTKEYTSAYDVDDLTLESGATLKIGASGALTVHGAFSGGAGSKITIAGGGSLSFEGSVSGTPDLYITGDYTKVAITSLNGISLGTIYVNGESGYYLVKGKDGIYRVQSLAAPVAVTLPAKLSMSLARDAYVTAAVSPETAGVYTWSSSNEGVVTVAAADASKPDAKLTSGISEGSADVRVTFKAADGATASASCIVTAAKTTAAASPKDVDTAALPAETVVTATGISLQPAEGEEDDIAYYDAPDKAAKTIGSLKIAADGTRIPNAEDAAARVNAAVSDLMPLPVAKTSYESSASGKKSVILTVMASGASMPKGAATVGDLSYLKLRRDTLTYDAIDRVESDAALAATDTKSVWLMRDADGNICKAADALDRNAVYELNIVVMNDGVYDHNTAVAGKVVDPGFLAYNATPESGGTSYGGGSGGGCSAGTAAAGLALLALCIPAASRRKK